jgi:hypothetical protein
MGEHWLWWILTMAAVGWYATITVFVSYKGVRDIKNMLRDLDADHAKRQENK